MESHNTAFSLGRVSPPLDELDFFPTDGRPVVANAAGHPYDEVDETTFVNPAALSEPTPSVPETSITPIRLSGNVAALASKKKRSRPWAEFPSEQWKREARLNLPPGLAVTIPKRREELLTISDEAVRGLRDRITASLIRIGRDEMLWLEQLTCLLNIAEYKEPRPSGAGLNGNERSRRNNYRKEVARTLWAFSKTGFDSFEELAEAITSLTAVACSIERDVHPGLIHLQNGFLRTLTTFEEATKALSESVIVDIEGISIRSFIPQCGASTSDVESSHD
jgi:hypothetical protein